VIIEAVGNRGRHLPRGVLEVSGNLPESIFHLSIGARYVVHAMALWESGMGVLVLDDAIRPHWYFLDLFTVIDPSLPPNWMFGRRESGSAGPMRCLWGYEALVLDTEHHDDLLERKRSALEIFVTSCESGHDLDRCKFDQVKKWLGDTT
jgi:hypothetical protein